MMTTDTKPTLTDTIHTLGEIRDHLRHHPEWVEALMRADTGLSEAERVIRPLGTFTAGARHWLAKHGARP